MTLQFQLTKSDTCDKLMFCDNTCIKAASSSSESIPYNVQVTCADGYNATGNINIGNVTSTMLEYQSLDGSESGTLFSGTTFLPGIVAHGFVVFQSVTVGATFQMAVDGVNIMNVVSSTTTDVADFIDVLVAAINSYTSSPVNYSAIRVGSSLMVYTTDVSGEDGNLLGFSGTTTGLTMNGWNNLIGYGNGNSRCYEFDNVLGDGVYVLTYTVTDGAQVQKVQSVVKIDCGILECLKPKIIGAGEGCGCCSGCQKGFPVDKVNWIYAELEAAQTIFDEKQYACADQILRRLQAKCEKLCFNC